MITFYIITFLAVCVVAVVFRLEHLRYRTVRELEDRVGQALHEARVADARIETFQTTTIQKIMSLESKIGDVPPTERLDLMDKAFAQMFKDVVKIGEELDELKDELKDEVKKRFAVCEDRFHRTAIRLHQAADDLTGKNNASSVPIADPGIVSRELMRRLQEQSAVAPLQYGGDE
jgi:hypothetical protein